MPKLPNVTNEDVKAALDKAEDCLMELHELTGRLEKGYADPIANPLAAVRSLTSLIGAAASFQSVVMVKVALEEQRREVETLLRARQEKQAASG